jgi:sulfatase maturation enzyme AslB (radical SAM superfamily)
MDAVSCELLTTGWCPNNCRYCYIPKSDEMKNLHQQIAKELATGDFIKRIKNVYGERLTNLGFWGTEPALTLDLIRPYLPELFKTFPKLKDINLSTSMVMPDPFKRFIHALSDYDVNLGIQISIDGPAFITDKNRFEGAVKTISENFFNLLSSIQEEKTKVEFHWKATLTIDNLREFNRNPSKIDEYYKFFDSLNKKIHKINKNKNIVFHGESFMPTLAMPGKYTSQDGKEFAEYIRNIKKRGERTVYELRLKRIHDFRDELWRKKRMFTCSGGDSNFGLDKNLHICHRTFYFTEDDYVKSILKQKHIDNWDVSLFEKGTIDMMKKNFIVDTSKSEEMVRFDYVTRNYHDFWKLQLDYIKGMMAEMALAGQIDKIYLENNDLTLLFAYFVGSALSCPMENLLNTGAIHFAPVSVLKIFGNGAFQEIIENTYEIAGIKVPVENLRAGDICENKERQIEQSQETQFSDKNQFPKISKTPKNPKIYFYNFDVGSGIEAAGDVFSGMLNDYKNKYPDNFLEYKLQNPSAILVQDLIQFDPDVIIINEFFPRIIEACYYYKLFKKEVKIIFLNHSYKTLGEKFSNLHYENRLEAQSMGDRNVTIQYALNNINIINHIINLNYRPKDFIYPASIRNRTTDMYFTLEDDIWKRKKSFLQRKKDFVYVGNLFPNKFSEEFIDKFSKTDMKMDIYGSMDNNFEGKEIDEYKQKIFKNKNFNYLGFISHDKLPDVLNEYRFLVIPHKGEEVFMMILLEAIRTGTIPLLVNNKKEFGDWNKWAEGLHYEFDFVDDLLDKMEWYLANKNKKKTLEDFEKMSEFISLESRERMNYDKFKKTFINMIFN